MYNKPAVCIMIPTYNQAGYILMAVESALAQDYPNKQVLVVDDCSVDKTPEIVQPYIVSGQIIYKRNTSNLGRVANYRHALYDCTNAEWVINLDGDDYFTNPHFISDAMESIEKAGVNNVLFYQGVHIVKKGNREVKDIPRFKEEEMLISADAYFFDYFKRASFSHMSIVYNRSLALQSGFYEKDLISADILSFLQFCLNYNDKMVLVSKKISGIWLQHPENSSQTVHLRQHWDNFGVYKKLHCQAIEKGYGKLRCFIWLLKARYMYLRLYAGSLLRKIKQ